MDTAIASRAGTDFPLPMADLDSLGFRRQQDGSDEPGEQAGRLDDTGVQGFHEDHRGAVLRGGDQLMVEGAFDVVHGTSV